MSTGKSVLGNERMSVSKYEYETLAVSQPREWVTEVKLNRPEKRNAMNKAFWRWAVLYTLVSWAVGQFSLPPLQRDAGLLSEAVGGQLM